VGLGRFGRAGGSGAAALSSATLSSGGARGRRRRILLGLARFLALDDLGLALGPLLRLLLHLLSLALAARHLVQRRRIDHLDRDRLLMLGQRRHAGKRQQPRDQNGRVGKGGNRQAGFGTRDHQRDGTFSFNANAVR
jgi:hypothetical protein